jgi:hypothetical protein
MPLIGFSKYRSSGRATAPRRSSRA